MSSPTTSRPGPGLLEAVAERLIPLFLTPAHDEASARAAAVEAITAHNPESPADYASIAQIIAFSLAAIGAIGQSVEAGLSSSLQLRYLGKANTLNRSAVQAERLMNQRRKAAQAQAEPHDKAQPAAPPQATRPATSQPPAGQRDPGAEAVILAAVEHTMAEWRHHQASQKPSPDRHPPNRHPPVRHQAPSALHAATP